MENNTLNTKKNGTAENVKETEGGGRKPLLQLINAAELGKKDIPPIQFLVDKMLAPGCCLLAGPHKGGKSYMALQLCLCVAGDDDFLGLPTEHGNCLYCASEDNEKRLQFRTRQLLGGKDFPCRLDYVLNAPRIGKGLEEGLEDYIEGHPDVKLIVVDTLGLARGEKKRGESDYDYDYRDVRALKEIADRHEICIILVHHMRKLKADDVFDEISGGVGIQAAADTIMTIQKKVRTDDDAVLHVAGRDVEADRFALHSDKECRRWSLLGDSDYIKRQEYENSYAVSALRKILDENNGFWRGTMTELQELGAHLLGFKPSGCAATLSKEINKLEADLKAYDGISHALLSPNGGKKGRVYEFRREEHDTGEDETVMDEADEVDEASIDEADDEAYFAGSDYGPDGELY